MKNIVILIGAALLFCVPALAQQTEVNDAAAARMLLGKHMISLQWVSWDYFGVATVTNRRGEYLIKGEQKGRGQQTADFVTIDGVITAIEPKDSNSAAP